MGYLRLDLTEPSGTFATLLPAVTSKPFPVLTHLIVHVKEGHATQDAPPLPDDFLGGSAPRLQMIHLRNIAFPALQTLLLSASGLVELKLCRIPPAGHILPVAMTMCLAELPRLKTLVLRFKLTSLPPVSSPHPPPVTRTIIPSLTNFKFMGTSGFLEDFVAHIDCHQLNLIAISYLVRGTKFQVTQLTNFFNCSIAPFMRTKVSFHARDVTFDLDRPFRKGCDSHPATTVISCLRIDWDLFRILNKFSSILSTVVDLKFIGDFWASHILSEEYNLGWLPFLHQLFALQALYVSLPLAGQIAHALKSVKGEVVAEALPSLDLICLEGQASSIEEFVALRQLSDRPLIVVSTEAEFDQRLSQI